MPACVEKARQEVNLALQDEFPEQCHRPFRRVGHDGMPAIRKSFELNKLRRQRRNDVAVNSLARIPDRFS